MSESSPYLPPEILDIIVDHLHSEPTTLKACSLVSKSWVPRTQRHLFAHVAFDLNSIQQWRSLFPDPSTSTAHHTRLLALRGFPVDTADATTLAHIRSFRHIVELKVQTSGWDDQLSLVLLHGLSPTLKSLSLLYELLPLSEILNLICSFPLLEDLTLNHFCIAGNTDGWDIPSTSPKLTGTLALDTKDLLITRALLSLPNGLHFSKIALFRPVEDAELTMEVLLKCSDTMESLTIGYSCWYGTAIPPAFDLSKFPKLRDVKLYDGSAKIGWIIPTLQSVTPKSLQRIVVHAYVAPSDEFGETGREWRELDCLLSRLWTSHSVLLEVNHASRLEGVVQRLFPELTDRGAVYDCWESFR